jgi:integrase
MTKTDMAKLPGLFQRGSVYQLRVVVPLDLKEAYGNKSKLVQSLETSDYRQAVLLATQERAKLLEEFQHKRSLLKPQKLDSVTPEMSTELAQRVRANVLRVDDILRDDPAAYEMLFSELNNLFPNPLEVLTIRSRMPKPGRPTFPKGTLESLEGLSEGDATALYSLNELMDTSVGAKLAQRRLVAVLPLVELQAHQLGLTFDAHAPGAREALLEALKAYRGAWHEVRRRDAGEVIDTPALQAIRKAAAKPVKLKDVYDRWKVSKPRSPDSLNTCLRSVALFEEFTGNPAITALTREQGDGFRTWLQQPERKTTSKTARDRLTWVKSLLKYAKRDLGLLPENPWEGIEIAFKTTNKRRPWTADELKAFFTQDLYTQYKLPSDKKAGADAAYWIPLLGLYSGARVSELAQLRPSDVEKTGLIHLLSITDEGEGQSVKSQAGVRKVPIHSELIRLGFLEYAANLQDRRENSLWPALRSREGKPGAYFSQWFGIYRKALGFGLYPDFHCLRHTVRSQMAEAETPEGVMDTLVGHEVKGSTGTKVYTHRTMTTLQKAIEVLAYPGLSLPKVYQTPHPLLTV